MIYSEEEIEFDKNKVLNVHINAYFGELENFKNEINKDIIVNFKETIIYCIINGCTLNYKFFKFCLENIKIKDEEYQNTLAICSILNGEWYKELKIDEIAITKHLFKISEEKLEKICNIEELRDIAAYLCTLKRNKKLFEKLDNPKMLNSTRSLIENYNFDNYFKNSHYKFNPKLGIKWFPIDFKYNDIKDDYFNEDIFEKRLTLENLMKIYGDFDGYISIKYISRIVNIEKYIYLNLDLEINKEINEKNILEDIRVCKKAEDEEQWKNIVECKLFTVFNSEAFINDKTYLKYIRIPYNEDCIDFVNEHQKWSIIYSLTKSNKFIRKYIDKLEYIELNIIKASYETCNVKNIKMLKRKITQENIKVYQLIDVENNKYINKRLIEDIDFDKYEMKLVIT